MKIQELISKYDARGVQFWVEDGNLHYKAHQDVLDAGDLAELKAHKQELIDFINAGENEVVSQDPENRFTWFPLTDVQSAYLLGRGESYELGGVGCHAYLELTTSAMDKDRLETAWHALINRHDMMRAVINPEGMQKVLPNVALPALGFQDVSGADPSAMEASIQNIRREFSKRVYTPDKWPLYALFLTHCGDKSIIHFSMDMLIADFLSIRTLLMELDQLYHDPGDPLPGLDLTFRDVVLFNRKRERLSSLAIKKERHKTYWLDRIEHMPGAPELPMALNKKVDEQGQGTPEFERHALHLGLDTWKSFCGHAAQRKITPSSAILAAYADVLRKWSARPDFCLGLTILDRREIHPRVNEIVGDFSTTSILEVSPDNGPAFSSRAKAVQEQLWTDMEHNLFTGVEVLREMNRQNGSRVLIPAVFTSTVGVGGDTRLNGEFMRDSKVTYSITQTPQVWIDCQVAERSGELMVNWDVRKGVFPRGMMDAAFQTFETLLNNLALSGDAWDNAAPLQLPEEMAAARAAVNDTDETYPETLLHEGILNRISRTPDAVVMVLGKREIRFRDLGCHAAAVQHCLQANGVTPGQAVAVTVESRFWQAAAALGAAMAGCPFFFPDASSGVLKSAVDGTSARVVLKDNEQGGEDLPDCLIVDVRELVPDPSFEIAGIDIDPAGPAYLFPAGEPDLDSGWTAISHASAVNMVSGMVNRLGINAQDRMLGWAGPDTKPDTKPDAGRFAFEVFGVTGAGACLVAPPSGTCAGDLTDMISDQGISILDLAMPEAQLLLNGVKTLRYNDLPKSNPRLALVSGEQMKPGMAAQLAKAFPGMGVANLTGTTTAGIWPVLRTFEPDGTFAGRPLPNQNAYILDDNLQDCPDWTVGELYIGGKGLGSQDLGSGENQERYLVHPGTGERLFRTGIACRFTPDAGFEMVDPVDTSRGTKDRYVNIKDIETTVESHPLIASSKILSGNAATPGAKMIAFAVPEKRPAADTLPPTYEALGKICHDTGVAATSAIDHARFDRFMTLMERTAVLDMAKTFGDAGLFRDKNKTYTVPELRKIMSVVPQYHVLFGRWLDALCENSYLEAIRSTGSAGSLEYRFINDPDQTERDQCWEELIRIDREIGYGKEIINFLKDCSDNLPKLLKGEVDILNLFFPYGKPERAFGAYCDNLVSRSLNQVIISGVKQLVEEKKRKNPGEPVRILEIGGGVAGLTTELAPVLDGENIDYYFTDVSNYFLNEAKVKFKAYPWIRYGLYNINEEYWKQGHKASSYDIILSSNVMHNSVSCPDVLKKLREIAVPDGAFLLVDAAEKHLLLTSFEFEAGLTGFTDVRAEKNQTFFTRNQWVGMLRDANAELVCAFPGADSPFEPAGQIAFITRFPGDAEVVAPEEIMDHLKQRLQGHMIPNRVEVVPELPFDAYGNLNMPLLRERAFAGKRTVSAAEAFTYAEKLEEDMAAIWAAILDVDAIGRDDDFFAMGGDSLLIAQVISKMRKELPEAKGWDWEEMSREMNRKPTIAALCEKLRQGAARDNTADAGASPAPAPSFVTLAKGREDTLKVFFHTGNGNLTPYRHLLEKVINSRDRVETIGGFTITDTKAFLSTPVDRVVEKLGQKYAGELLESNASKIELIGYCSGGLVAFETARLLKEAGVEDLDVYIISTDPLEYQVKDTLLLERAFGKMLGIDLAKIGHIADDSVILGCLGDTLAGKTRVIPEDFLLSLTGKYTPISRLYADLDGRGHQARIREFARELSTTGEKVSPDMLEIFFRMFCHNFEAVALYDPRPFAGDITLLRVEDQSSNFIPGLQSFSLEFWERLTLGGLEVIDIRGHHFSCVEPPHVEQLSRYLAKVRV